VSDNAECHFTGTTAEWRYGKQRLKRCVLRRLRKTARDGADVTWCGKPFQTRAAATGKARSPTVDSRVWRTISNGDEADWLAATQSVFSDLLTWRVPGLFWMMLKEVVYIFYRYHWRNCANFLLCLRLLPARPGLLSTIIVGFCMQDGPAANQCTYNVSIRATNRFLLLGKPSDYHTLRLQFHDVIVGLVTVRAS